MTQDEIIRIALQAAQSEPMSLRLCNDLTLKAWTPWLEKFAGLVVLKYMKEACDTCVVKKFYKRMDAEIEAAVLEEREACAKVCETDELCCKCGDECAAAIRAMGCKLSSTVEENTK